MNALEAKVVYTLRLVDVPGNSESSLPPEKKDWIAYAILKMGDSELQLSDLVTGKSY